MQTTIQAICSHGKSLREAIEGDVEKTTNGDFQLVTRRRVGRNPGWATIKSKHADRQGTIRLQLIDSTDMLLCRVVNRESGRPNLIVGDFVDYLLRRHSTRVKFITILPDRTRTRSSKTN